MPAVRTLLGDIRRLTAQIEETEARALRGAVEPLTACIPKPSGRSDVKQVDKALADISARLRELEKPAAAPHRQGVLFGPPNQPRG